MIAHVNRGRITVDLGGNWRLYTNTIPNGSKALGIVDRGHDNGALVLIESTGLYVQVNAGVVRNLPQSKVVAAVEAARAGTRGGAGRGQGLTAEDGAANLARKQVMLDPESVEILTDIGSGNLSLGIRRAAQIVSSK
jgi:hypothetical protein